jgi:dipeptidyl-peptidase-4
LWGSERTGFRHLYLYGADGKLIRPITQGEWMVDSLVAVDGKGQRLWFSGTKDGVTERHLYEVGFDGGEPRKVTTKPGSHGVVIDHGFERYIDIHSSLDQPPRITVRSLADDSEIAVLHDEVDPRIERMKLKPPRLVTVHSRDGIVLHGAVYEPTGSEAIKPYRTMVSVYGGPHAQRVTNSWGMTVDLRAQFLRSRGILVFKLDNRGSARRGLKFEGAIKHDMGNIEVQDQVDGVQWLVSEGLADPQHVGMYGWSYGGYMSAISLARAPETFSLAVAGAPVTHWDGYDTHYTERYMGTPQSNPEGYEVSAVMKHVENMSGKLMLVHGMIDENVHFRHTARLINALIAARKEYQLLMFPDERHSPRRLEDRVYMEQQIFGFIDENL